MSKKRIFQIVILLLFAFLIAFGVNTYHKKYATKYKIGDESISKLEYQYYYNAAYNEIYNSYKEYMGIDTSRPLSQQMYDDEQTWADYLKTAAKDNIVYVHSLVEDAKDNDFTFYFNYSDIKKDMEEAAKSENISLSKYIHKQYGEYANQWNIKQFVYNDEMADAYYDYLSENKTVSEEEVNKEYQGNKKEYDSVDYYAFSIYADIPEGADMADLSKIEKEQIEESYKETKKKAEVIANSLDLKTFKSFAKKYSNNEEIKFKNMSFYDIEESEIAGWMFQKERTEGDTFVLKDKENYGYTIAYFVKRYKDMTPTKNIRLISVLAEWDGEATEEKLLKANEEAHNKATEIYNKWKSGKATETTFSLLAEKYDGSDEDGNTGGYIESITNNQSVPNSVKKWLFEEKRKKGDTAVLDDENSGSYIIYFVDEGKETWYVNAEEQLKVKNLYNYVNRLKEQYKRQS